MLTENQLQKLASESGISLPRLKLPAEQIRPVETEKDLVLSCVELLSRDGAGMNFLAAGSYDFYRPVALQALDSISRLMPYPACGASLESYQEIKKGVESKLAQLVGMENAKVLGECLSQVLKDLLLELYSHEQQAGTGIRQKVLLAASMPPGLRSALRTQLKYQCIETVVIGFDTLTGQVSRSQLEELVADDLLAILLPYPNFFGVLENVADVADWAQQYGIKTIVLSDALSLTYLKPPAQLSEYIDYTLCDLQPLGFPLSRKGNALTLRADSANSEKANVDKARLDKTIEPGLLINELMTIQSFFACQSANQIQQAGKLAQQNLTSLIEKLVQIPAVSLKFESAFTHECVIHFDSIDLNRALQILAGHNILAGYPLGDEFPELENCLLIHCTDQHDLSMIDRFVQKMATVVKNLSTAGCPVKPKFT